MSLLIERAFAADCKMGAQTPVSIALVAHHVVLIFSFTISSFSGAEYMRLIAFFKIGPFTSVFRVSCNKSFINSSLDFVYIDGNHQYSSVIEDLNIWYPKVKYRGIIAGDDYKYKFPGVIRAVNEFANLHNLNIELLDRGQFILLKTKPNEQ